VPRLEKPRALPPGGTVGIAAPAGPVDPERLAGGEGLWKEAGFRVVRRDDVLARQSYLAGDDARRAAELAWLWSHPSVDAIVCARGGYGSPRILSRLDAHAVRAARKPLVGYSDVTALLLWQRRQAGLVGFHGPMLEQGSALDRATFEELVAVLTGRGPARRVLRGTPRGGGRAAGRLVGGSLSLVVASLGTPWEAQTRGAILLFEEVGEKPYRIDRMLAQLRAAGKLDGVAGIGIGALVECGDPRYPEVDAMEVLLEALRPLGVPVVADLPFGHVVANRVWPIGARADLDGDQGVLVIRERGVALR
jgi:muramoyltetrapeptide carboxypeptidase